VLEHENWQSGTFSVVHKAMWTTGGTKRSVAVKMYRSHAVTEAMNSPAFTEIGHLRDIEAMGSHPNLVNFVYTNLERAAAPIADGTGFGSSSGECPVYACLMTELEPLGTLLAALEGAGQDKLDKHSLVPSSSQSSSSTTSVITLPWLLRLKVAHDVAKALAWLHEHLEILHFDVKAENVLLCSFDPKSPGPKAKLFDLTSAKSKSERWTSKHAPNTTPSHAAPEVFALADKVSTSRLFNEAVDVFAFGILCAELILGGSGAAFASYPPTSTALEMGEHVRKGCRPDLSPAEATVLCDPTPGTPHGFLNLARHCWAHLPDERPSVPQICSCLAALVLFNTPEEIENSGAGDGGGCSAEDGRVVEKLTSAIDKIDHLSFRIDDLTSKLDTVQDTLLRGVFEASQLHVPSCFVVVSERLKPHSSYAPTTTSTAVSAVASASASAGSNSSLSGLEEQLNWSEKLIGVVASVWRGKGSLQSARETVASFATKKVYLYLVDELTFRPIVLPETNAGGIWAPSKILSSKRNGGGVYPIKISQPAEVLKRLLPVLTLAIGAAALLDGTLALAQLFGLPPHARLPKWWLNSASKAAKWIREGPISSEVLAQLVEDSTTTASTQLFLNADGEDEKKAEKEEELHFSPGDGRGSSPLPSRGVGVQKAKGEAFRALEELIHSADPDRTYCGLERKITRDGRVVFALPASLSASGALLVL
jgi:serine/threonine protein kinase